MDETKLRAFADVIMNDIAEMSGLILWRVKVAWANQGRTGGDDRIVVARTAIEAIDEFWGCEDPKDLRTVEVEWMGPIETTPGRYKLTASDREAEQEPSPQEERICAPEPHDVSAIEPNAK